MHHVWFNGDILPADHLKIPFTDLGLMRGYGLFDYFRTYNGKPFQWDWYWERYENSAEKLGIENPLSKAQAHAIVLDLINRLNGVDCAIRFLLTGGFTVDSVSSSSPNLFIISEDIHASKPEEYQTGIKVISYEYVRDMYDIKSTDYKHFMFLQPAIKAAAASDVLFHHNGLVSELSRSNVFLVNGRKLITPERFILKGITRRTVLDLAQTDFDIEIRDISLEELLSATEVFTTSTTKRVLPITQVDNHLIGSGKIGPGTALLLQKINHMVQHWS